MRCRRGSTHEYVQRDNFEHRARRGGAPARQAGGAVMRQAPAVCASERLEAAWDREVGVPPGVRTDSKTGSSSHTGLATAETGSELTLELL